MRKTSLLFSISLLGLVDLVNSCCTGVAGTAASNFDTVLVDPDNAAGGALTISNTETQTSGELVKITGIAGKTAFKVAAGNTDIQGLTTIADLTATAFASGAAVITGGSVNGAAIGATGAAAGTFNALTSSGTISLTGTTTIADLTATAFASGAAVITGGSVNGAAIGATGAAAGTFNALTSSGTISLTGTTTIADLTATALASGAATFTGTTTVATLTDGTASLSSGAITGATTITAANLVATDSVTSGTNGFKISGTKVVGAQQTAVADCAATIAANGAISGTYAQGEVEALRDAVAELQTQVNSLLAKLRTHGLIA